MIIAVAAALAAKAPLALLLTTQDSRFIKGGAVETGCSDLYDIIY